MLTRKKILKLYRIFLNLLCVPFFLRRFLQAEVGIEYNVSLSDKWKLLFGISRNVRNIPGATSWWEHIMMVEMILSIPASLDGAVVECGCFNGLSTASLSLACSLTGRRLKVFDSFKGLPEPAVDDQVHRLPHYAEIHSYKKGNFKADVQSVKRNLETFGKPQVCDLIPGFFSDTLPFFSDRCVFVFVDVDLRESLKTCLKYLYPLLQNGCRLYTHEAHHLEIAQLFFDKEWWSRTMDLPAPGLIGAGTGLAFNAHFGSAIGYTIKDIELQNWPIVCQDTEMEDEH